MFERDERWLRKICVHCKKTIFKMDALRVPTKGSKRWCCEDCYNERYGKNGAKGVKNTNNS